MEEQTFDQDFIKHSTNIFNRVSGIITKPKEEWEKVNSETPNIQSIIITYILPLAIISGICTLTGYAYIGLNKDYGFIGTVVQKGWSTGIQAGIISVLSSVIAVFVSAYIINVLSSSFKSEQNLGRSVQLVSYSFTPAWIGGIFAILPSLGWIGTLLGLYGLYLLYLGLMPLMKTPKKQALGYLIVSILVIIVSYILIGLILTPVISVFFII